jgi:hypothetical protein
MFLLYHSDGCNTSETVFHWCYVNDLHTTHAVVCWVTTITLPAKVLRSSSCISGWGRSQGSTRCFSLGITARLSTQWHTKGIRYNWLIRPIPEFVVSAVCTALENDWVLWLLILNFHQNNGISTTWFSYHAIPIPDSIAQSHWIIWPLPGQ